MQSLIVVWFPDGVVDIAKSPFPYTEVGNLPEVPQQELPPCGGPLGSPLCTRERKFTNPTGGFVVQSI